MLQSIKNFSLTKLHDQIKLPETEFQQWLTDLGMLHRKRTCDCGTEMRKEKHGQYGRWICKKKSKCRKTKGALVGTFFGNFKLSLQQVIQVHFIVFIVVVFYKNIIKIMYFWSRRPVIHINQTELERETGVSVPSLIDWQNFLRDIAGEFCNQNDRMIGGEGVEENNK